MPDLQLPQKPSKKSRFEKKPVSAAMSVTSLLLMQKLEKAN